MKLGIVHENLRKSANFLRRVIAPVGSSQLWLCCEGKPRRSGLTSTAIQPENWFWKEAGCTEDSSTVVGQMKVSAKHVTKKKAQKSTFYHCPEWRFQMLLEGGSKKREPQRSGNGKEVL